MSWVNEQGIDERYSALDLGWNHEPIYRVARNIELGQCLDEGHPPRIADEKTCARCRCYHPAYLEDLAHQAQLDAIDLMDAQDTP